MVVSFTISRRYNGSNGAPGHTQGYTAVPMVVFDSGFLRMTVRYVRPFKGGVLYYYRRIPKDVQHHYPGRIFRKVSLGTKDPQVAAKKVAPLVTKDEALWKTLRSPKAGEVGLTPRETRDAAMAILDRLGLEPGSAFREVGPLELSARDELIQTFEYKYGHEFMEPQSEGDDWTINNQVLNSAEREAWRLINEDPKKRRVLLSDALDSYLCNHDKGHQKRFQQATKFAINQVIEAVGDLPLEEYHRQEATKVRDHMLATGVKTASVRRRLNTIKAVFARARLEFDLQAIANPFERLQIKNEKKDSEKRIGFTHLELETIAAACVQADDDIRHITAMTLDLCVRLSEIVGLRIEDVALDHKVPHIYLREDFEADRTLKTEGSERKIPLLGTALWGATRAVENAKRESRATGWLFPRYASDEGINGNSASAAINKWLRESLSINKTTHCFRHAMKDRLRFAEIPKEIQDALGGWGKKDVSEGYGEGYRLTQLSEHFAKVIFWPSPELR
jgi:integrase